MGITPEKQDVDISRLFVWGNKFSILDIKSNPITDVYIRLVGDAELGRAKTYALRASGELRKKLKDKNSDDYYVFISSVDEIEEQEEFIDLLSMLKVRGLAQDAEKEVYLPFPKEPKSDADLEDQEKYQQAVDNYPEEKNQLVNKYIVDHLLTYKESIKERSLESLKRLYINELISQFCERELVIKFRDYCVFAGSFKDAEFKEPLFKSIDEFLNLPTEVKDQFISAYASLEINADDLKKSLEVTQ